MKKRFIFAILAGLILMAVCAQADEQPDISYIRAGGIVTFGWYEQDGNPDNGPEKIEWIVLDVQKEKCLLLSRYCLDAIPYHSGNKNITWKDCSLRKWLNSDFLKAAFTETEQEIIALTKVDNSKKQGYEKWKKTKGGKNTKDRVFLLSYAEAKRYFGVAFGGGSYNPAAQAEPTAYAAGKGAYIETVHESENPETRYTWWWLRSPGCVQTAAAGVGGHGTLLDTGTSWEEACVRPALWVNLDEYAGIFLTEQPYIERKASGDYTYTILEDGTTQILRYSGSSETAVIPEELDGRPVAAIGESAFEDCSWLTAVTIPDSVAAIGDFAFSSCRNLVTVRIPDRVEKIGDSAFAGCSGLAGVTIPDGVKTIGNDAFSLCKSLTSIDLPDSVETIGNSAFADCSGLKSFTIPGSVKKLGEFAFYLCKGLESVTIGDGCTEISDFLFSDCISLVSVTIPDSVQTIGIRAFWGCSSLASFEIPDSVTAVGTEAFGECTNLASVRIPDSVASMGDSPFTDCAALNDIRISPDHPYLAIRDGVLFSKTDHRLICFTAGFAGGEYAVPDGTQSIGERAFWDCETMVSVTLPDSVETIGEEAFAYCVKLRNARIPKSVTAIGSNAFYGDQSALTVAVDRGSYAEQYCKKNKLQRDY